MLDQFERNQDQQQFILTIFNKLDERSRATPDAFAELPLTVLSEVAANGVQTISSVTGEGMALCEQAMTTLLQGYISERSPAEWKALFKEATNIAFMVKYMFRESLDLARRIAASHGEDALTARVEDLIAVADGVTGEAEEDAMDEENVAPEAPKEEA